MIWLLLACVGGPGPKAVDPADCETVYQAVTTDEVGDTPSGYQYCTLSGGADGSFDRVSSESCEGDYIAECTSTSNCDDDEVCLCASGRAGDDGYERLTAYSQCVAATCAGPDDCDGEACGVALDVCGGPVGHFCRAPTDVCRLDSDCGADERCSHNGLEWLCVESSDCG